MVRIAPSGLRESHRTPFDPVPRRSGTTAALAAELRHHILQAVSRATAGASDVAVLVSGGLDSSGLLAATLQIAKPRGQRVRVFNLDFGGPGDDRPHLAALCDLHGVSPVRIRPAECVRSLRETLVIDGRPVRNPILASIATVLRGQGVSLVLTGEGGDDVLGGDMRVFLDRAWRGHPLSALRDAAKLRAWGRSTPWSRIRQLVLVPSARRAMPERARALIRGARGPRLGPQWAGPELRRVLTVGAAGPWELPRRERSSERSWLVHRSRSTEYMDCSDARAQVELVGGFLRVDPLLDHAVVDFVASLCPDQLFHGHWLRGLYREALRGWVPESLRVRTDKADVSCAFRDLAGGAEGLATLRDLSRCDRLADLRIVEPHAFQALFEQLVRTPETPSLWTEVLPVLSAETFLQGIPGSVT